jgi:mannose-6-phosphate isomerase-like protein (cupin superfamily)
MKGKRFMYNDYNYSSYPSKYHRYVPTYNPYDYRNPYWDNPWMNKPNYWEKTIPLKDYGPKPFVVNMEEAALQNNTFRTALWTGKHFQVTLMSIQVCEDIGLEVHPDVDQFIRIEQGQGLVLMGDSKDNLCFRRRVYDDYAIVIPAGKWHNLINVGCVPIKLYSIYAPPEHPYGTVHETKEDAEEHHNH